MARRRRGSNEDGLSAWPGYVDALSTLLMVIIFVLLVFVLAQAFLGVALTGRDKALERVNHQVAELSNLLALERGHSNDLSLSLAQLNQNLAAVTSGRDSLAGQLEQLRGKQAQTAQERDRLTAALADATRATDAQTKAAAADAARLNQQILALTALRDELERQVRTAAGQSLTEAQARAALAAQLADEQKLGDTGRAQIALLNQQLAQLRQQVAGLAATLDASERSAKDKDVQIANLGSRLNAALAQKVQELQGYRSDFFGRLRQVLADQPGIQVVGDRFVFQSEVLFPTGSADLSSAGTEQLDRLADTLKDLITRIPPDVNWLLRVDGHADRKPSTGTQYASNWELSAARAITVVRRLIADGVPADRLAATGFGDNQPIDPASTADAYARNRRIEFRLTDR